MTEHGDEQKMPAEYPAELRDAVNAAASAERDWPAFHYRLNAAVASTLADLRIAASAGAAWWDYASRAGMAAVPIGLAAALLLFGYLRDSGSDAPAPVRSVASAPATAEDARAAFESALTGDAARRTVMATLLPAPSAAFLGDSSGGGR